MWNQDLYAETYPAPVPLASSNTAGGRGWLGKVGAGCDYQFNSRFVIGAFGDYDFMSLSGTIQDPLSGLGGSETERSAWAVGGRVGYLVTPTLLTYVNGGYTGARFDQVNLTTLSTVPSVAVGADIAARTSNGWFIGGGDEVALEWVKGLFWRTEYRYSSYQGADLPIVVTATGAPIGLAEHVQKQVQTIATELVWRFNWPGPVATRY
jgi:outer membrane immunogenic protein